MKHEIYIHAAETLGPFTEISGEALREWRGLFPGNAARRMTPLGLMLGWVTRDLLAQREEAVVYSTTYSEASTLEKYLDSFPTPSPLYFQTCIHPGGIEQVLIAKQCAVDELIPLAGAIGLAVLSARCAMFSSAESVLWCGGEELATWLADLPASSPQAFAFALRLCRERTGASARLTWQQRSSRREEAGGIPHENPADLPAFFELLQQRRDGEFGDAHHGRLSLEWL